MLTAFVRRLDSTTEELPTLDAAERAWSKGAAMWIDLKSHLLEDLNVVRKRFELHPGLLDECELCELRPRWSDSAIRFAWSATKLRIPSLPPQ